MLVCGQKSKNQLGEKSKERLDTMCRCYNGFEIAESDLKLRGPGDFFGSRQHGLPSLKVLDIRPEADEHSAKALVFNIAKKRARP